MDPFTLIITATLTSLRDHLPGRIVSWNAANAVQLEAPPDSGAALALDDPGVSYVFGGRPQHPNDAYPVVEVASPDATLFNLSLGQVAGDLDESLVVTVWAQAPGEEFPQLYRRAIGYAWCATEVLLAPSACGGGVKVGRVRYSWAANPDQRDRSEMRVFTMGAFLFLSLETTGARP